MRDQNVDLKNVMIFLLQYVEFFESFIVLQKRKNNLGIFKNIDLCVALFGIVFERIKN